VDELSRPFFTSGSLLLQECLACGAVQHPPEHVCFGCQGGTFRSREVAGSGTIYSHTVVHHPVHPMLSKSVPYAVVLVSLDECPEVRIVGNVMNRSAAEIHIGQRVRVLWEEIVDPRSGERVFLPQWEVVG
jgi:uncharacterized OB-fold protein